jgi:hypothetical protein
MLAGIVAVGAFFVSFIISLCVRTPFLYAALQALCFSGVFFGIVAGVYFLYDKFLSPKATEQFERAGGGGQFSHNVDYSIGDDDAWLNGADGAESMPPEAGAETADGNQDAKDVYELLEEVSTGNEDEAIPFLDAAPVENINGTDSYMDHGVLEQSANEVYNKDGALMSTRSVHGYSGDGFDMNMSAFIPGMPVAKNGGRQNTEDILYTPGPVLADEGSVSLSVDKISGKRELDFDFNRQKAAGAIQTLLKKDEG